MKAGSTANLEVYWTTQNYESLSTEQFSEILRVRESVFVIEQQCDYEDNDGLDPDCIQLIGRDSTGELIAYTRILPPGLKGETPSFGRVLVIAKWRGLGIGRELAHRAIKNCLMSFPGQDIIISAQTHLTDFYSNLGFQITSEPYEDVGISHTDMVLHWK